ncbi:hypothetical protein B0T26DRAFT_757635 [Lasiosphaeria miniovina]|uniref:Uncharacterized protein n=1 Tax=Lasiosphaeria miniovina TaxID=1954250 RepID=A0AA39ZQB2_9PEZI|nr:uncharacterized protein B0T26DRAFT_757635 [Lasiosphaeria miniovina]KAK0701634.1 hypothetical protein B0T26DRAFT_757635 [Lasiosphaeria miniovina]
MATESPKERSDEAIVTSDHEPAIQIDTNSHNVGLDRSHVNGDGPASAGTDEIANKHISDIVDDLVHSSEVSISGGSDNEASRGDATKDKGHGRTSSTVKKPASFKSISVNKTFLTTKGTATVASKPGDKLAAAAGSAPGAPSGGLVIPRPRLIAKTGSGLVTKSSSTANGRKAGSAPDPSVVWNKNRPVPPPEPKKYTDEELKKYGIHMATRLAPDGAKGQANWADIDDDDEDWAPETITWKDGTKISIPHTEEPAPVPETAPHIPVAAPSPVFNHANTAAKENGVVEKPKSPAPGVASTMLTIKPGVLGSGKGLVLKGVQEKPTLVAKPPAPPTPVKSPWAPIPKVDKVSPVIMEIPGQSGAKFPSKDVPLTKTNTPPPPKEIAADDFSRAPWRDGGAGANRELYNSQSGRYEPVPDRRGSRPEGQHNRQPALLQRSGQHDQQGPAEPSAAFQTTRNSEQLGPYGRRRGSSNVSGGSGSYIHRLKGHDMPMPPPEFINARRGSATGGTDSPASPRNFSPSGIQGGPRQGQNWPAKVSPVVSHAIPIQHGAAGPEARPVPPPVQQPAPVPLVTEEDYEIQKRLMRERRELAMKRRLEQEAREEAERKERIALKLAALGPPPESNKAKKASAKDQATTPTQIQPREALPIQEVASITEAKAAEKPAAVSATPDSPKKTFSVPDEAATQPKSVSESTETRAQGNTHAHPWPNTAKQPDRYPAATWGATQPATAKNVWGSPNNNRSLGNGTFITDLGTSPLAQLPAKSGPGPIAPPTSARSALVSQPAAVPASTARQPPIAPPKQTQAAEMNERELKQSAWVSAVRLGDDAFRDMLNAQYDDRDRRLQKEGRALTDIQPAIKDTWRPTKLDDSGARAEAPTKQTVQLGQENPWASSSEAKAASVSSAAPSEHSGRPQSAAPAPILGTKPPTASSQTRGSRFFPPARDIRQESNTEAARPKSPSPPPPDMAGHPAFDGDVSHPHVSLPPPPVVVRLPPAAKPEVRAHASPEASSVSTAPKSQGPSFSWATTGAYKESDAIPTVPGSAVNSQRSSVHKPENMWQAKIDSLLGGRKTHTHSKPTSGDYRNQNAHDHSGRSSSSRSNATSIAAKDGSVTTKDMAEECFEEQEMGSLPPVRLPNEIPEMAWQPSPPPKPLPKRLFAQVSTAEAIRFPLDTNATGGHVWHVSLPGHELKTIPILSGRTRSNPRRGGVQRGGRTPSVSHYRQGKGRDGSSSYLADQATGVSGSNPPASRSSRGGSFRGRDNWSRNSAAPIQT